MKDKDKTQAKTRLIVGWLAYPLVGAAAGEQLVNGDLSSLERNLLIAILILIPVVFMIPMTVWYLIEVRGQK